MSLAVSNILTATFLFTALNVCVKFLPHIPTSQIVWLRGMVSVVMCFIALKRLKISPWGVHKKLLITRGIFGTISLFCLFYCLQRMPIAMAMTLSNLAPLFTVILAHFILHERGHWLQSIFLLAAFGGVVLVKGWDPEVPWLLAGIGILGAFAAGCAYTSLRVLRNSDHPLVAIFYFPLVSIPLMAGPALSEWVQPSIPEILILFLIGVLTQFAQYFMTLAYQMEKAAKIMIYNYAGIVWALLVGWLFFNEKMEGPQLVGLLIIVASLLGSSRLAMKTQ